MPDLNDLLPKKSKFQVTFTNGKKFTLHLRPYTLRDEAYLRDTFDVDQLALGLQTLDPTLIASLVWRQLEPKSKAIFDNVKAVDQDDNEVELEGHEKLMESFGGLHQIVHAFNALMEARGINSVIDSINTQDDSKKKMNP